MNEQYAVMRQNVSLLGKLLGETIKDASGETVLDKVELIRQLSKSSRLGQLDQRQQLLQILQTLSNDELLPVTKAFNQFLNLVNTAEQYHSISPNGEAENNPVVLANLFARLLKQNVAPHAIEQAVNELSLDLVLTAHPTEVARRTMIHKLLEVNHCLHQLDHDDLADYQRHNIMRRLRQLVAQAWYTDEIRKVRPTPIDEVKWGFAVVENSLWEAVPTFLRELHEQLEGALGTTLPVEATPVRFSSWMGGDRDGNPFVTATVTRQAMMRARWKASELFLKDIQVLVSELSMSDCTQELRTLVGEGEAEPYRAIMKVLRSRLMATCSWLTAYLQDSDNPPAKSKQILEDNADLWEPLYACYQSLIACNMAQIANGPLLDTLLRVRCFGLQLIRLDVRQDSMLHARALGELTRYLGMGDYVSWSENDKQAFLIQELNSKRPLVPLNWTPSAETAEVLATCKVVAEAPADTIAAYVISMAHYPSDVLAVHLLLKEMGCAAPLSVVPLFETLDDLQRAESVMRDLYSIDWYRGAIHSRQMVMIGYSDSAKDAGVLAAAWAQYEAQEALIALSTEYGIHLTLFHGRGGTIGRGGAPAHAALLSQPPGSLKGGLRVTEQGEMIRFKLGLPEVAVSSLTLYTAAVLEANLLPPPQPLQAWRDQMDQLSTLSCQRYREVVRDNPDFSAYFHAATPDMEISLLPLGSRPAKRNPKGGIESLRAIPWIFAWTQNRLMLPAWLGAGAALQQTIDEGKLEQLRTMCQDWPFFATRINMLEMVFAKTDLWLTEYYDRRLVDSALWPLGQSLREELSRDIETVLALSRDGALMSGLPWIAESIALRNIYTDPLNLLQVELLSRSRDLAQNTPQVEQALMISIAGIAAGMRNTG